MNENEQSPSAGRHRAWPLLLALMLVGLLLGGLLVGFEPVGGDPDRMYRPLKSELARALRRGRLPFWSDRFGLGVPLVAESHVAAFYPPNWVLYRLLDVATAYRLSMWLHELALVAATYFYARTLKIGRWGGALAGVALALCGFQAVHASHEPFYCALPYLPLALALTERYLAAGGPFELAALALVVGAQWTIGHFQIQAWTVALAAFTALWRLALEQRMLARALAVGAALALGTALAAVQLGPSRELSKLVGQTERSVGDRQIFAYPPEHWFEPALPRLVRDVRLGPDGPYWAGQGTTGYEAVFYVGTVPLVLAFVGALARPFGRATSPWRVLVPLTIALAMMPRYWPAGHEWALSLPVLGDFRAPARLLMIASLGLALLAGEGLDRTIAAARFRIGLAAALAYALAAAVAAMFWARRPDVHLRANLIDGLADGFYWAALAWAVALPAVLAWRKRGMGEPALLVLVALELGALYYSATTAWGWSIDLPADSPVLCALARLPNVGRVGGALGNLPVRAGLATARPYLGFLPTLWNRLLLRTQERLEHPGSTNVPAALVMGAAAPPSSMVDIGLLDPDEAEQLVRWLRRGGATHLVEPFELAAVLVHVGLGREIGRYRDPALDRIVYHPAGTPSRRLWSVIELKAPWPQARAAPRMRTAPDHYALINRLSRNDDRELAWFLAEDLVPNRPEGRSARVARWDGTRAEVNHDGPCDLVVNRAFDPGWSARVDDGPARPVLRAGGGVQAVRLNGDGTNRVAFQYRAPRWPLWAAISGTAAALDLALWLVAAARARNKHRARMAARRSPSVPKP